FKNLQGYFDLIVADAPCSGSGMFRKDPGAVAEWSPQNVALCSKRQQRIIRDSWPALKENGILIYSTCSYSVEENEAVTDWIAETFEVETIPVPGATTWGVVETVSDRKQMYGYRFYPDKIKGEGFFIACMRKKATVKEQTPKPEKLVKASKQEQNAVIPYLADPEQFELLRSGGEVTVLKKADAEALAVLFPALYIKKVGTRAGRVVREELIPAHDLALSTIVTLNLEAIAASGETVLDYLRKKDIPAGNAARGWNVVRFMGYNVGWVKVLSNRVNNYYPPAFRILKR
ncbi:MAG TPA: RNA methyltransferase, partial [Agriterribacter sp.]|nr:RNA methyltransferase [Agriterribacter sp.]